jgi:hypothetical protein
MATTNELAVGSRSMMQVMPALAIYTEVPEQNIKDGHALPSMSSTNSPGRADPVKIKFQIKSARHSPREILNGKHRSRAVYHRWSRRGQGGLP